MSSKDDNKVKVEEEQQPRRKRRELARVVRFKEEELHHPLHTPYVRKKDWLKEVANVEPDDESGQE